MNMQSVEHQSVMWYLMWESSKALRPNMKLSGQLKHWSPNEELYEKLFHYDVFLKHEEAKWTTLTSAPIAQRNNQAPSRNNITWKQASNTSQGIQLSGIYFTKIFQERPINTGMDDSTEKLIKLKFSWYGVRLNLKMLMFVLETKLRD